MVESSASDDQRRLVEILESIADPIVAFDKQWRYTYVSRRAAQSLGKTPEEMSGKSMWELFPKDIDTGFQAACQLAWKEGRPVTVERHSKVLGVWVESYIYPFENGAATQWRDITERKRKEEERLRLAGELAERAGELQAILDAAPVIIWIAHDPQCLRITGNAFTDRIFMHSERGQNISLSAPPGDGRAPYKVLRQGVELRPEELPAHIAATTGQPAKQEELDVAFPDGRTVSLLMDAVPLFDADGRTRGAVAAGADITERKRAEEALRASEERHRLLAETMLQGVVHQDADGRIIAMNPAAERILGRTREEYLGSSSVREERGTIREDGSPFPGLEHPAMVALRTGRPLHGVVMGVFNPREGAHRWISIGAVPLFRPGETTASEVYTVFEDITERKRAEEALRESEAVLRSLFDSPEVMRAIVELVDGQIVHIACNEAAARMYGMARASIRGKSATKAGAPEEVARAWVDLYEESRRTGKPVSMEYARRDADGLERWLLATAGYLGTGRSGNPRFAATILDLTERKRAEEALRQSEERYRTMFDTMLEGFCIIEVIFDANAKPVDYRFLEINPAFERQTGLKDARGRLMRELAPEHEAHWFEIYGQVALTGRPARFVNEARALNRWYDVSAYRVGDPESRRVAILFNDITESKRAEDHLRQAQKLESLGLLAGGVAHDFNNLLVGIIGNASLAQDMLPPDNPAVELLEGVVKTGEQAAHLTRQMLAYSGKGKFVVEPLNLSALIPEMSGLVRPSIPRKIAVSFDLDPDLPAIEADRGQVQQVFMNLALNAAEAIGSRDGLISISTGVEDVDERYRLLHPGTEVLVPGQYIRLEVRDTGCGMDEATQAKIFDPFFSTKFVGRGLGLAAVAGILRGHKGAITVSSAPGKGSCFTVLFPASERAALAMAARAPEAGLSGKGTVLVVDDEPVVRGMAEKVLERHGYTVLVADSGQAAINILRRHPGDIALVLLDLSMPYMNGEEVLPELRKIRPDLKVVVSSGYSEAETMALFKGQQVSGFVQKPYTSKGLAEKVKVCLG
jgi:PAS domain S-box-containing protein